MRNWKFVASVLLLVCSLAAAQQPSTIDNDSSCDIGVYPAATLLLPYFRIDLSDQHQRTTKFTITNVSPLPQIARATIWTDWAYPVLTFNIFLTGYDVQRIDLYDVIARGIVAGPNGTSTAAPNARTPSGVVTNPTPGTMPLTNLANPNFLSTVAFDCAPGKVPGVLPASVVADTRSLLTSGLASFSSLSCNGAGDKTQLGSNHGSITAIGYMTVDVVATCSSTLPTELRYFANDLLFDNVLTGDYEEVSTDPASIWSVANTMVHIRAVPEGGGAGSVPDGVTPLPFTFYDRLTAGAADRRIDRRQPLPSTFAARLIAGGPDAFETWLKIWREATLPANAACTAYVESESMPVMDIVRFDEHENAAVFGGGIIFLPVPFQFVLRPAEALSTWSIPVLNTIDTGGWLYLNLSNGGSSAYSPPRPGFGGRSGYREVSQNWVTTSMSAQANRFAVEIDGTALGNGCTPARLPTDATDAAGAVSPSGGVVVCPPGTLPTNGDATACKGSNINP